MGKYREKGTQVTDDNSGLTQEFWVFGVLEKGTLYCRTLSQPYMKVLYIEMMGDEGRFPWEGNMYQEMEGKNKES